MDKFLAEWNGTDALEAYMRALAHGKSASSVMKKLTPGYVSGEHSKIELTANASFNLEKCIGEAKEEIKRKGQFNEEIKKKQVEAKQIQADKEFVG